MSFRNNLLHLRSTRNMTQEHLAMLAGVSRQSVAKWEAERSYPEMDKLLKLCQIFDCSLDDLVRGDLTTRVDEPDLAVPDAALGEDVVGYDSQHRTLAWHIAAGVGAILVGLGCAAALDGTATEGVQLVGLFAGVVAGLALIIPAGLQHAAFKRAHPYVVDFYTNEQHVLEGRALGLRLVVGIASILAGIAGSTLAEGSWGEGAADTVFLLGAAVGVGAIVYGGIMHGRLNIEEYNISALEELDEEEIAGIVGAERAPLVLAKVRRSKRIGVACGVIMLVATAIALPLMFWATSMHDPFWSKFFWIPWMVGGLCCGIVTIILSASSPKE